MDAPDPGRPLIAWQQPDPDYRKAEGLSQSAMKEVLRSPAHYRARYGPDAEPFFPTPAMQVGTAVHALLLEPEEFERKYCSRADYQGEPTVAELQERLTADAVEFKKSAKKAELLALAYPDGLPTDSRTALGSEEWRTVHGVAEALRSHDLAGAWFDDTQPDYRKHNEVSIYAQGPTGQTLKARLDRIQDGGDRMLILDLKTTDCADPSSFARKLVGLNYDLQAAWYSRLAGEAFPDCRADFLFVAVERKPPYAVQVYRADESVITSGLRKMDRAISRYSECVALDYWPSYDPEVLPISMPRWATMPEESCLEF